MTELCYHPETLNWVAHILGADVSHIGNTVIMKAFGLTSTFEYLPLRGIFCPAGEMV